MEQTVPSEPLAGTAPIAGAAPLAVTTPVAEANYITKPVAQESDARSGEVFGNPNLDQADAVSAVNIQTWLNQSPWRITAGWSAVAGLLSMGVLTSLFDWRGFLGWPLIILALLLVDPLWGSLWRFAWGRDGILPLGKAQQGYTFWLPYLKNDSPAGRLMGESNASSQDLAPLLFRVGLPTVVLSYIVSATLGATALWLTSAVIVCVLLGWLGRRTWGKPSASLQAIVTVALPWILIVLLFREKISPEQVTLDAVDERFSYSFLLVALWTVHSWGIIAARRVVSTEQHEALSRRDINPGALVRLRRVLNRPALPLLILADVGIVVLMLVLQEPLWLALLVPLWLPTWFAYLQGEPVDRQPIWRLAAILVSAIAIGQTPLN